MITWSISTKPCPIITWDGVVFNGEHHFVDHIYYMIHAWHFGLSVPRPYLHMLGSSSLTRVFCMCKTGLHPLYVNVELTTPDHHVVSRHDELWQRCILRENTFTLKFSERSSYNATVVLSKIRCIKDKHHMQSNKWYDMAIIILCLWSPSPKHRHDFHRHRHDIMVSIVLIYINVSSYGRLANYCFYDYRYRLVIK